MSIDKKIQEALLNESSQIDEVIQQDPGLFSMLGKTYKGNLRFWVYLTTVIAIVLSGIMIWAAYEFFVSETVMDRIFWGVWFLASLFVQAMVKLWTFMEANRLSLMREIKRIETLLPS